MRATERTPGVVAARLIGALALGTATVLVMRPNNSVTYDGKRLKVLRIQEQVRPLRIVLASRGSRHQGPIVSRFIDHAISFFEAERRRSVAGDESTPAETEEGKGRSEPVKRPRGRFSNAARAEHRSGRPEPRG